jgi:hypothetical protein
MPDMMAKEKAGITRLFGVPAGPWWRPDRKPGCDAYVLGAWFTGVGTACLLSDFDSTTLLSD